MLCCCGYTVWVMIQALIGWKFAVWAVSTQLCHPACLPSYCAILSEVDFILFHIYLILSLSSSGCVSDSFWRSELSFWPNQRSLHLWASTHPTLRAICGLQYEGPVSLYIIIIKVNQTQWEVWLSYFYTVFNTSKSKHRLYVLDRQTFNQTCKEIVQVCLCGF